MIVSINSDIYILQKTQLYYNDNITSKNYRFLKRYILEIYNLNIIELLLNPVLIYLNDFSYCCYL